jgi:hypothetical protein
MTQARTGFPTPFDIFVFNELWWVMVVCLLIMAELFTIAF